MRFLTGLALVLGMTMSHVGFGDTIKELTEGVLKESSLAPEDQVKELQFFVKAARPYEGMTIRVVSETIDTHVFESKVLAPAFTKLTGIKVVHDLMGEGDVIEKLQTELLTGRTIYDMYVNDSDLIGTHFRSGKVLAISDFIKGEGKDITLPSLDLEDFIGLSFATGPDGKVYQLPDQQFANLYWFRHDWFSRADLKAKFKQLYGYELGVPVNWSAYEDIAKFFSEDVKMIDGKRVYGHMDYGKKDPSLGWRFTDAWLSMAGTGSVGLPNGLPVDEWGIRVDGCHPVGASMARGGATNSPASVYALTKYMEWLKSYAPPEAQGMTFSEAGPVPGQGQVAQQIFWYSAFTKASLKKGLPVVNEDGTPKWRMAPSPRGPYWQKGMKLGYQDAGSWTMLKSTPAKRRKATWLYAQFTVAKSVTLSKFKAGLTPIRQSDLDTKIVKDMAPMLGGLVEFYRSPARKQWTPTGTNVPDYPRLSQLWWQNISSAVSGEKTPKAALDKLALDMDKVMKRLSRLKQECGPKMARKPKGEAYWLAQPGSPKPRLANEKPPGQTIVYEDLLKTWQQGQSH